MSAENLNASSLLWGTGWIIGLSESEYPTAPATAIDLRAIRESRHHPEWDREHRIASDASEKE